MKAEELVGSGDWGVRLKGGFDCSVAVVVAIILFVVLDV